MSGDADRRALAEIDRHLDRVDRSPGENNYLRLAEWVVAHRDLIRASLRTPPFGLGGDGGAEAMRAACVRWHLDRAAATNQAARGLPGHSSTRAYLDSQAEQHRGYALALGALKLPDSSPDQGEGGRSTPPTDGATREGTE